MSDNITDLDTLVPDDKKVALKGETYIVPGDMPLTTYLKVSRSASRQEEGADQAELLESMVDAVADLFVWKLAEGTPEREERHAKVRAVLMSLGLRTVTQILGKIYPSDDEDLAGAGEGDEPIAADAVDPPTAGTTTS